MKRTILLGSTGLLGRELKLSLQADTELLTPGREVLDVRNPEELRTYLHEVKPATIINAVGLKGDAECASEPELAHALNTQVADELAQFCHANRTRIIHFSCADVYGELPSSGCALNEDAATNPQSVYAKSKLSGDFAIQQQCEEYLIFRLTALYDGQALDSELGSQLAARDPIIAGAPTSARYVADIVARILSRIDRRIIKAQWGVYHLGAKGAAGWRDFIQEVIAQIEKKGLAESGYSKSQSQSGLSVEKIEDAYCLSLPTWQGLVRASNS